jgi:hypothetical protein
MEFTTIQKSPLRSLEQEGDDTFKHWTCAGSVKETVMER